MMRRYDVCLGRDRALVFDDVSVFERTCLSEKVDKVVGYGTDCTCNGPRCNQDAKYAAIPVVGKLVQRWQDLSDLCAFAAKPVFLATLQDNMDYCLEQTTEFFCGSIQVAITRLPTGRPEKTKNRGDSYVR